MTPSAPESTVRRPGPKVTTLFGSRLAGRPEIMLVALAAALLRLPGLGRPLSSDEGGYLLVASQWSPGTSLYGNYWVDRPPFLFVLFHIADASGGRIGLRLLGIAAVVVSVLLAARIGSITAPGHRSAPLLAGATAAVFLTTPFFGANEVNGELLAAPWVLGGIVCLLQALNGQGWRAGAWWAAAGVAAMAAALVKQSIVDLFVVALVVGVWLALRRGPAAAAVGAACFALGALTMLGTTLAWAAAHGTYPAELWDAVVTFRRDAAVVISREAVASTPRRGLRLVSAFLGSGAVVLVIAAFLPARRPTSPSTAPGHATPATHLPDVRLIAAALLTGELAAAALGGSYWLHYLLGTVPGLVLVVSAVAARRPTARVRWVGLVITYVAIASVVTTVGLAVRLDTRQAGATVAAYLSAHKRPGDTAVVAFGNPAILQDAHLRSPYPQLWSLPVRVRDPRLAAFTSVLTGPEKPTWVVVSGASLATWGVDTSRAQPVLDREYQRMRAVGPYWIYRLRP